MLRPARALPRRVPAWGEAIVIRRCGKAPGAPRARRAPPGRPCCAPRPPVSSPVDLQQSSHASAMARPVIVDGSEDGLEADRHARDADRTQPPHHGFHSPRLQKKPWTRSHAAPSARPSAADGQARSRGKRLTPEENARRRETSRTQARSKLGERWPRQRRACGRSSQQANSIARTRAIADEHRERGTRAPSQVGPTVAHGRPAATVSASKSTDDELLEAARASVRSRQ